MNDMSYMSEKCFERKVVDNIVFIVKMAFSENVIEANSKICEKSRELLFPKCDQSHVT